jgi:tRNA(Leu) C34 or U34 (ribose-2'-O)-methylase TrmL
VIRGYAAVGLHMPKTRANVGSVLRAAGCYGVAMVAASGQRFGKAATDTQKAYRHLPLLQVDDLRAVVPYDCVPVAVDLIDGARNLCTYEHPERAFYIFGPEDGTLGKAITSWCRDVIYIPTSFCMNLAATVNVVLYDRMTKRDDYPTQRPVLHAGSIEVLAADEIGCDGPLRETGRVNGKASDHVRL